VSNNKPFVKSNLLRYKSHNTISITKQFIRNNVQQGECLTQSLQIWIWPSTRITLFERTRQSAWLDAVTTPLIRSEWILVYQNTSFWREFRACPRVLTLPRNSGMPPYSTADQTSRTNDPDSIHGSSQGVSWTNSRCFVPRACIQVLSSAFLASVHDDSQMAYATIAVMNLGPEGLFWNRFLLAVSARFSRIRFLHSGYRAGCVILFPWKNRCSPFVKTKVTSHCLHVTVMSCSGPSATASVCCCDATSSVSTSSIGIWIWSRREKIRLLRLVRSGVFSLLMNSVSLPERMIDVCHFIAAHFVRVMVYVPSFPFVYPELNRRAAYLPPWMHVFPHQVLPIVLPARHHSYSCPKSVSDDVFPIKNPKSSP